ncbi:MAG TPA: hypothetical protein VM260_13670 [Pirellula sp.]|nr:hypothetical protein [Pirellula sp.]
MSLRNAKLAPPTGLLTLLTKSYFFASLSVAVSVTGLHAQDNFLRLATAHLPTATDAKNDLTDPSQDSAKAKKRDPLVLPALTVPNTSLKGVGMESTPEDLVVGRLPSGIALPYGADRYGFWDLDRKTWTAPVFCHQPTYFEDTMLERHGHERLPCLQPLVSGARFFSNIAFLPYQSYIQPPLEERYSPGHYRPGSAAPCLRQRAPYDAGALRFQLLTTGTTILALQP